MKHKHYDVIVAKAANMGLVVFENDQHGKDDWYAIGDGKLPSNERYTYFLCLPQHKEACLHWLNGGDVQHDDCSEGWATMENINEPMDINEPLWSKTCRLMTEHLRFRIKPKKEKRWIGYCANTNQTFPHPQKSKDVAEDYAMRNYGYEIGKWQFLEIEIEVEV